MLSHFSRVQLFVTIWTVAPWAPLSLGFSRQEYWSGLLFLSPGDLSNPRIKPRSPVLQADALTSEPPNHSHLTRVKKVSLGTSLGVQGQRLCLPNAEGLGLIPGQGTRSYMPQLTVRMLQLKIPYPTMKKKRDLVGHN